MNEEQILYLIEQIKVWGAENKKFGKKREYYFNEEHEETSEHAKNLSYHAEFGVFPTDLIAKAAPNEEKEEFEYRKENYKQITKPAWDKALSFIYRIFNEQNYSVKWTEEQEGYFTYEFPKYGNFIQFFQNVVTKMKFADPNAVIVVRPYDIPTKQTYTDEGEIIDVPDQSAQVQPFIEIFKAENVFVYKEGVYTLLLREEKSKVKNGAKYEYSGLIFDIYDKNAIYRLTQVGNKDDYDFDVEIYYEHNWDFLPAWRLGGVPVYEQDEYYYHSYFSGALPNLDMAAIMGSTLFAVISKNAFPTRWYYEDTCNTCNGEKTIIDYEHGDSRITCPVCSGSGKKFSWTWGKDFVVPVPENLTATDTTQLPTPPFGTVEPGTEIVKYLDEKINSLIETAFVMLNIDISAKPNGQTATESKIDREEAFSFLLQISGELFELMQNLFDAMGYMRWDDYETERIEVIAPSEFTIRSSEALTDEFSIAQKAGLPAPYLNKLLSENIRQRFKGDAGSERVFEIVSFVDPLMTKTEQEIASMLSMGSIQKWQAVLHANIYRYIYEQEAEKPGFIEGEIYKDIYPVLKGLAEGETPVVGKTADQIIAEIGNLGA